MLPQFGITLPNHKIDRECLRRPSLVRSLVGHWILLAKFLLPTLTFSQFKSRGSKIVVSIYSGGRTKRTTGDDDPTQNNISGSTKKSANERRGGKSSPYRRGL